MSKARESLFSRKHAGHHGKQQGRERDEIVTVAPPDKENEDHEEQREKDNLIGAQTRHRCNIQIQIRFLPAAFMILEKGYQGSAGVSPAPGAPVSFLKPAIQTGLKNRVVAIAAIGGLAGIKSSLRTIECRSIWSCYAKPLFIWFPGKPASWAPFQIRRRSRCHQSHSSSIG